MPSWYLEMEQEAYEAKSSSWSWKHMFLKGVARKKLECEIKTQLAAV